MSVRAYVGLGANLGDARETIERAIEALKQADKITCVRVATLYGSDPVDAQGPTFVNTVAEIRTTLEPLALLDTLQAIEREYGRERPYRNAPRTLDLDLLWFEGVNMDTPRLILPHPRMHERAFVLKPLHDLTHNLTHELNLAQGKIGDLLQNCHEQKLWPL